MKLNASEVQAAEPLTPRIEVNLNDSKERLSERTLEALTELCDEYELSPEEFSIIKYWWMGYSVDKIAKVTGLKQQNINNRRNRNTRLREAITKGYAIILAESGQLLIAEMEKSVHTLAAIRDDLESPTKVRLDAASKLLDNGFKFNNLMTMQRQIDELRSMMENQLRMIGGDV